MYATLKSPTHNLLLRMCTASGPLPPAGRTCLTTLPKCAAEWKAEEIRDLGNGLTFAVILQKAHVVGSSGSVQLRYASVAEWIDVLIVRNTTYTDIDEARAAAERLAQERG